MGFKHQIELNMSWLIFLCLSYHEQFFEAKIEAEVRLLEVICTFFEAIRGHLLQNLTVSESGN